MSNFRSIFCHSTRYGALALGLLGAVPRSGS